MNQQFSISNKIPGYFGFYIWLLAILCFAQATEAQSPKKKVPIGKPSLDSLVARIDSYWDLLLQRKRIQAAKYVDPSERENFLELNLPAFSDPKLKSLELSASRYEATVVVSVKRNFPIGTFDWPVTERWAFKDGQWYLQLDPAKKPFSDDKPKATQAESEEAQKHALRAMIQLEPDVLDFGMVHKGDPVSLRLKCLLSGSDTLFIRIEKSSPALEIIGLSQPILSPGKAKELTINVPTFNKEGIVSEHIVLTVRREKVEVAFRIPIQGFVYVPVSISPKRLRLNFGSEEREKVVTVSNHSRSDLELQSFSSPTGAIEIEPIPAIIPAGQKLALKVRQIREAEKAETPEVITISFARPIEDTSSLTMNVILNALENRDKPASDPAKDPNLQQQIRKNLMNIPSR